MGSVTKRLHMVPVLELQMEYSVLWKLLHHAKGRVWVLKMPFGTLSCSSEDLSVACFCSCNVIVEGECKEEYYKMF